MSQVEVAKLLGRHKSWVCRRVALIERFGSQGQGRSTGGPGVADGGAADRAVAGGQPDRSVGGDPARNVDHGGVGRRGGSLVRLCCRTASARVPPAASSRSLIAGQRNVAHRARSSYRGKTVTKHLALSRP